MDYLASLLIGIMMKPYMKGTDYDVLSICIYIDFSTVVGVISMFYEKCTKLHRKYSQKNGITVGNIIQSFICYYY